LSEALDSNQIIFILSVDFFRSEEFFQPKQIKKKNIDPIYEENEEIDENMRRPT
jgi:hypothetical protein